MLVLSGSHDIPVASTVPRVPVFLENELITVVKPALNLCSENIVAINLHRHLAIKIARIVEDKIRLKLIAHGPSAVYTLLLFILLNRRFSLHLNAAKI